MAETHKLLLALDSLKTINGIRFRLPKTKSDFERATDFYFDVFHRYESCMLSKGGLKGERPLAMIQQNDAVNAQQVSIMAEDVESGKLVGYMQNCIIHKNSYQNKSLKELQAIYPKPWANMSYLLDSVCLPFDKVFEKYEGCEKLFYIFNGATDPKYQKRGIAMNYIYQSLRVAKAVGCDCAASKTTSDYSAKTCIDAGFEKLSEIKWKEQIIDGEVYFDNVQFEIAEGYARKL